MYMKCNKHAIESQNGKNNFYITITFLSLDHETDY